MEPEPDSCFEKGGSGMYIYMYNVLLYSPLWGESMICYIHVSPAVFRIFSIIIHHYGIKLSLYLYSVHVQLTCSHRCMRCLIWTLPAGLPW